ncbi:MAG TPA: hypothetical protein VK640_09810 [Actinomycetes bacterium]|nr:hypothetical protein [Actinomycetes bacterium]
MNVDALSHPRHHHRRIRAHLPLGPREPVPGRDPVRGLDPVDGRRLVGDPHTVEAQEMVEAPETVEVGPVDAVDQIAVVRDLGQVVPQTGRLLGQHRLPALERVRGKHRLRRQRPVGRPPGRLGQRQGTG